MRLSTIKIEGYKRLKSIECQFGHATFLIGPNNAGKSSVLSAINHYLLSNNKRINEEEYYSESDEVTGERKTILNKIILIGKFKDVPIEAKTWRGFKGRIFEYDPKETSETGLSITYRKTYELGKDVVIEIKTKEITIKAEYSNITYPKEIIEAGVPEDIVREVFEEIDKKITPAQRGKLEYFDELWNIGTEEKWFQNPGGIPGVVLSRLPRYIIIPADMGTNEISGNGVLQKTLNELFEDVRNSSDNYKQAQKFLNDLAKELDPSDESSQFGKMITELNTVISNIFPESKIHAKADLSDPDKSLKPTFKVELSSNIKTSVDNQGAGMIRSAVFGILRFRQKWLSQRGDRECARSVIIGFEEPEIYLHPSAANQMRDTIYELSSDNSQIIATTHSPYLIDLSRKPKQVLNRFSHNGNSILVEPFNVTDKFIELQGNDKSYVKMIMKIDDYISRVFFTKRIVIVEGDTEEIVIRETLRRLDKEKRLAILSKMEVVRARGKASIIGLSKYLKSFGINIFVIHDRDKGVEKAEIFNKHISDVVGEDNVIQLEECIEYVLGYTAPKAEKPYTAYNTVNGWGDEWTDIPEKWRKVVEKAFEIEY